MEYLEASLSDLPYIIELKNEVKERIIKENLNIWLNDYPNDLLLKEDIKNNLGRIVKINGEIVAYACLHDLNYDYEVKVHVLDNMYSFSRIMVKTSYLNKGVASFLISKMLEEKKDVNGFTILVDSTNLKALNLYKKFNFEQEGKIHIYGVILDRYTLYFKDNFLNKLYHELYKYSELKYLNFSRRIINTKLEMLGVRKENYLKIIKELKPNIDDFKYYSYEEIYLAIIIINKELNPLDYIYKLAPYLDNWALTDSLFKKCKYLNKHNLFKEMLKIALKEKYFLRRCMIVGIMANYLKEVNFKDIEKLIYDLENDDFYYVKMALAWLLTKLFTLDFNLGSKIYHNLSDKELKQMTKRKINDSYLITKEEKEMIK